MISKGEAISRLKKMGVSVADDQSIVTILLPKEKSLTAGIKDIKEKMKVIDYNASFCIKQKSDMTLEEGRNSYSLGAEEREEIGMAKDSEKTQEEIGQEEITQEELNASLLSMDDDGQFTLGGFGMDF